MPYHRPHRPDQEPLPTSDQIRDTTNILGLRTTQTIIAVGSYVVKYGRSTSEVEGQNLLYIENRLPFIRAPRLQAMYLEGQELYLIMDRIPGENLEVLWDELTDTERHDVSAQLRKTFAYIRSIASDSPFYGSVCKGPMPEHTRFTFDDHLDGPFDSEEEFNQGLIGQLQKTHDMQQQDHAKGEYYQRHLSSVLKNNKPVLTHADVHRRNVIIHPMQCAKTACTSNGSAAYCKHKPFDVTLVDWEDFGWYPSYWEFFSAYAQFDWNDDWPEMVERFLKPRPCEAAILTTLYLDR